MERIFWLLVAIAFIIVSFWIVYQITIRLVRKVFGDNITLMGEQDEPKS